MKRLWLGVLFGSLLTLIGLQAVHVHASAVPETCAVCALGQQSQGDVPSSAPRLEAVVESSPLAADVVAAPAAAAVSPRQARGPPALS